MSNIYHIQTRISNPMNSYVQMFTIRVNVEQMFKITRRKKKKSICQIKFHLVQSRPLEDVYLRRNETFIPGQSVQITEITAERTYNPVTEFLYPYL